jgi:hypothetical protein
MENPNPSTPPAGNPPAFDFNAFKAAVPPEYQDMGIIKESPDVATMLKRVKDLNEYRGQSLRIPTSDASPEVWGEFAQRLGEKVPGVIKLPQSPEDPGYADLMNNVFNQLGRPADVNGYKLPEIPEGVTPQPEAFKAFGEMAHQLGLTQKQFEALAKRELETQMTAAQAQAKTKADAEAALKAEFGAAYETKTSMVKEFLQKFMPSVAGMDLAAFGPATVKEFAALAEARAAEGGNLLDTAQRGKPANGPLTPGEAKQRITEIRGNRDHAYHKPGAPGHADAVAYVNSLYKQAYGTGPANQSVSFNI